MSDIDAGRIIRISWPLLEILSFSNRPMRDAASVNTTVNEGID